MIIISTGGGGGRLSMKVIYPCAPPFIGQVDKFLAPLIGYCKCYGSNIAEKYKGTKQGLIF